MKHGEGQAHLLPLVRTSAHPLTPDRALPRGQKVAGTRGAGPVPPLLETGSASPRGCRAALLFLRRKRGSQLFSSQRSLVPGGEWLRTLFLKWLFREASVHTSSSVRPLSLPAPHIPLWAEGHLVARGLTSQASAGNASAPPIVSGQEARFAFQSGNKTSTLCSAESAFPSLTLRRQARGFRLGGCGGDGQEEHHSGAKAGGGHSS